MGLDGHCREGLILLLAVDARAVGGSKRVCWRSRQKGLGIRYVVAGCLIVR
jgi:hypothetical protein